MVNRKTDGVLKDLIAHLTWCLAQYEQKEDFKPSPSGEEAKPNITLNWSPLQTLRNNLLNFCGQVDSEQSSAVAELLVYVLDRVSTDLFTDTPWDEKRLINDARNKTQAAVLKFFTDYKEALEASNDETDKRLWQSFREFTKEYNLVLTRINEDDLSTLKRVVKLTVS